MPPPGLGESVYAVKGLAGSPNPTCFCRRTNPQAEAMGIYIWIETIGRFWPGKRERREPKDGPDVVHDKERKGNERRT